MKGLGPHLVWAAIVATAAIGCAGSNPRVQPGPNRLYGKVVGPNGEPIDGVRITTEPQTDAVLSFEGAYEITRAVRTQTPLAPGKYQIVPYKLGWWRGQDAPPISVEYPGQQYNVPDIRLIRIEAPRLDDVAVPEDSSAPGEVSGTGVVRGGE